jgi:(1->4)-alpha-D-glucan 1-alpha-D-glucosylmutase
MSGGLSLAVRARSVTIARPAPTALYRLQLCPTQQTLDDAGALAGYLAELGISHAFTSPLLQAAKGSTHGYDVVDPTRISNDLGGMEAYFRFSDRLVDAGMGHVLDIVPNHMGISAPDNPWWSDVLAHGKKSRYAGFFDIEWDFAGEVDPALVELQGRVLVPVLTRPLREAVLEGEVRLARQDGDLVVLAGGQQLPVTATDHAKRELTQRLDNGGVPAPDLLSLLDRQHYRLTHWRVAGERLNYRRFFTITSLAALRAIDADVFEASHALILELVQRGRVQGLRIDHLDGLRDPELYLERLHRATGGVWTVVEKILEPGERLSPHFRTDGTTGYEVAAVAGGLFVDPAAEPALSALYTSLTGEEADFHGAARIKRQQLMRGALAPEVRRLTRVLDGACDAKRLNRLVASEALIELLSVFPVYRTYLRPGEVPDDEDVRTIDRAIAEAKVQRPDLNAALEMIRELLLSPVDGDARELAYRLQETSGAVMAKGVEDTALYTFNRFVANNEVGADPSTLGVSPAQFHSFCLQRQSEWPLALSATSTHDTKRSEDVRARLYLLSEIPERWETTVREWFARNGRHRRSEQPDPNMEYFIYQTLVGAWPLPVERALPYFEKAAREAKVHTSWTEPNPGYELALGEFTRGLLADDAFRRDVEDLIAPLEPMERMNSLGLTLLKLTAPGIPDIYQGTEIWDFSLVDPDNRRPVDFATRRRLLSQLTESLGPEQILARAGEGLPKLWVIRQALHLRRRHPDLFAAEGAYHPLWPRGSKRRHLVAFARSRARDGRSEKVVTAVPRLVYSLSNPSAKESPPGWADTTLELPAGRFVDVLSGTQDLGGVVRASDLFARFPVALLESREDLQ